MSYPVEGPIPVIDLLPNASLTIEAVDPTTGATVAGVSFSQATLYAEGGSGGGSDDFPELLPLLTPTPAGEGGD